MTEMPKLKQRIAEPGPLLGCWLEMFSPIAAEVVAQAGYDCVLIDLLAGKRIANHDQRGDPDDRRAGLAEIVGLDGLLYDHGLAKLHDGALPPRG